MSASATGKAIDAMIKWSDRPEWRDEKAEIIEEHIGPVCDEFDIGIEDIDTALGPIAFTQVLGCIFEDFLTCRFDPDDRNPVEDYLKRRGFKASGPGRQYLQALQGSVMSLYEVVDTVPGSHFLARDLIRGGEPIRVDEKMGSASLVTWDRIAARLLPVFGKTLMSGGVLPMTFEDAEDLVGVIADVKKRFSREVKRTSRRLGVGVPKMDILDLDRAVLSESAPLFTQTWLMTRLNQALNPSQPLLVNDDGEDIAFTQVRFPLADPAQAGEVKARLDGLAGLARDVEDMPQWSWLSAHPPSPAATPKLPAKGVILKSYVENGERVLGQLWLEDGALVLEANSVERAERGREWLAQALGPLVGPPLTETRTPEQAMAERKLPGDATSPLFMSPEETAAVLHEVEDEHYHALLDTPLPHFGGKTPRQAARSKAGRQKVAQWLKLLENTATHRARAVAQPVYDFTWMWHELKVLDLRR